MRMRRSVRSSGAVRRAVRLALIAGVLAPAMIAAQGGNAPTPVAGQPEQRIEGPSYGRVSLLFTESYDDNVFAVPLSQHPQSDLISRFGPMFEVGRHTRRFVMNARYGLAAERYAQLVDLNSDVAHQEGMFDVDYHATPRATLHADGGYIDTQSPRELNQATLITIGRGRAERLTAHAGFGEDLSKLIRLNLDYTISNDTLEEQPGNLSHNGRVGLQWQTSMRTNYRVDYRPRYVVFGSIASVTTAAGGDALQVTPVSASQSSHAITAGFTHAITPLTSIELDGGPRVTDGSVTPEITAAFRRRMQKGDLAVAYTRTQDTAIGEVGFFDVQRLTATASVTPVRALTLSALPAFARSTQAGDYSNVRELNVEIVVRVVRRLSFVAFARAANQEGTFGNLNDPIQTRYIAFTTRLTLP
ncbi:MAG TPA: hypothetical protein VKB50_04565 [Vicinamibacterales bacterium]|nr:hypothetical protein [Vicinamibacterales bacterium]